MTLKEALNSKRPATASVGGMYEVKINLEVVEPVWIVEYIKASSPEEARSMALKQFNERTHKHTHDRARRNWENDERFIIQNLQITTTNSRKRISISPIQREILKKLMKKDISLEHRGGRWYLMDSTNPTRWWQNYVPSVSVGSLFQKGLLTPLATIDMRDEEIEVQEAVGSLPETKAYTINMKTLKNLRLRI